MGSHSIKSPLIETLEKTKSDKKLMSETEKLRISKKRIFEVAVVSTMSSGKSTFINALIGDDFLPSLNQACTSRTTAILDNDSADGITAHILYPDGRYAKISGCDTNKVSTILMSESDSIADIVIECSILGIRNIKKSLFIVDTPGVNNISDSSHEEITHHYLEAMENGLVIYVLDSTQLTTTDHSRTIEYLRTIIRKKPNLEVLFLLNKADEIDPEKELLDKVVLSCVEYLAERDFSAPCVFPVSSDAALLIKKAIYNTTMSKAEVIRFKRYYEMFKSMDFSLSAYAFDPDSPDLSDERMIGNQKFSVRNLFAALENTGISAVEREIEKRMIRRLNTKAPKITKSSNKK